MSDKDLDIHQIECFQKIQQIITRKFWVVVYQLIFSKMETTDVSSD
jgi:hypothetical protein